MQFDLYEESSCTGKCKIFLLMRYIKFWIPHCFKLVLRQPMFWIFEPPHLFQKMLSPKYVNSPIITNGLWFHVLMAPFVLIVTNSTKTQRKRSWEPRYIDTAVLTANRAGIDYDIDLRNSSLKKIATHKIKSTFSTITNWFLSTLNELIISCRFITKNLTQFLMTAWFLSFLSFTSLS